MKLMNEDLSWIWKYLKKYPLMTYTTIFGSMIEIILFSMPSLFVAKIVDLYLKEAESSEIYSWLGLMLIIALIQVLVFYFIATVNEFLAHRVTTDMTADLFETLQNRPMHYHDQKKIGDIMARATGDTRVINIGLSPAIRVLGQVFTAFIFAVAVLLMVNIQLSLILIFSFPIFIYSFVRYGKNLEPKSLLVQERFGELNIYTSESFTNVRDIKSYNIENQTINSFTKLSKSHASQIRHFGVSAAYYYPGLVIAIVLASTSIFGVAFLINGNLEIAEFILFVGLISHLGWLSQNLQFVSEFAARTGASAMRLRTVIDEDVANLQYGNSEFDPSDTKIEFQNVSFSYNKNSHKALDDVSVTINSGETVAIVGGPGSGKSTFIKLILRLYNPDNGFIRVGEELITGYSNESLREQIAVIEQEIFLFSNSIKWNVEFGREGVNIEEVYEVAKLAHAHDFIEDLPEKYETQIGEKGVRLSGGQKQRVAIARALLMNPSILIMDDASSALDSETEYKIQQAIRNVLKTRTSLIITHRLSLIAEANNVLVFHKGQIVAYGPHKVLIRTSEEYRSIFKDHYELPMLELQNIEGIDSQNENK